MLRVTVFLLLLFLILLLLRVLRQLLAFFFAPRARGSTPPREVAGEMVRDPICGTWIDRRLALSAGRGRAAVAVCSEKCRDAVETASS